MAGERRDYKTCERACTCPDCLPLPTAERRLEAIARAAECRCIRCEDFLLNAEAVWAFQELGYS